MLPPIKSLLSRNRKNQNPEKQQQPQQNTKNEQALPNLELEVQEPYFSQLQNGQKTVEGRLMSVKNRELLTGNVILFTNKDKNTSFRMLVTKCEKHSTFFDMLNSVGFQKCIPDATNIQAAVGVYHSFPGYQQKEVAQGVVCYHVVPENNTNVQQQNNVQSNPVTNVQSNTVTPMMPQTNNTSPMCPGTVQSTTSWMSANSNMTPMGQQQNGVNNNATTNAGATPAVAQNANVSLQIL